MKGSALSSVRYNANNHDDRRSTNISIYKADLIFSSPLYKLGHVKALLEAKKPDLKIFLDVDNLSGNIHNLQAVVKKTKNLVVFLTTGTYLLFIFLVPPRTYRDRVCIRTYGSSYSPPSDAHCISKNIFILSSLDYKQRHCNVIG